MNNALQKRSPPWWQGAFLYQIHPRSFKDGTLNGITQKLDYIAGLGVEGIWICPFFKSPMKDFGYDVADYRNIDPQFGTLDDFDTLLKKAHSLGLKIIIDLVLSHSSDQHKWFSENPEYYVWADAKPDLFGARVPPNNWVSVFGGAAWTWNEDRKQFYLHNFLSSQPDLNFHNPKVQEEALNIAKFWLERGIDGFRLDVVNFYFHDRELRDNPPRDADLSAATQFEGEDPYSAQNHIYDKSRPENLPFLRKLQSLVKSYGAFTIGEIGDDYPYERTAEYTGDGLLDTCYNPQMMAGTQKRLTHALIREPFENLTAADPNSYPAWAFSNHDVVRAASRWLPESDGFSHDPRLSKMLIALLGSLYGTLFLYQGEELGLPEAKLKFEDLQDPWGKSLYPQWQGRDGCRTPMPWDKLTQSPKHWLPIPQSHKNLTIEAQQDMDNSTLSYAKNFIKWRKSQPSLRHGDIYFNETETENIIHITRTSHDQTMECIFNISKTAQDYAGYSLSPFGVSLTSSDDAASFTSSD